MKDNEMQHYLLHMMDWSLLDGIVDRLQKKITNNETKTSIIPHVRLTPKDGGPAC